MDRIRRIVPFALTVLALVLEAVPFGAVLNFKTGEGNTIRRVYSYFDLVPFGYANFGPLLTGIFTVLLLCLSLIALFRRAASLRRACAVIACIAAVCSLFPLLYGGFRSYSVVGGLISATLIANAVLSLLPPGGASDARSSSD